MKLNDLLAAFDAAAANLSKLEAVLDRAEPFMPTGPARGHDPEYDDLGRAWADLLPGLPLIDGWTVSAELPDLDDMGQEFIDYFEISEYPGSVYDEQQRPRRELSEYRYRLNRARRRAAARRLRELVASVDTDLAQVISGVPRDSQDVIDRDQTASIEDAVAEIERLMADASERTGRWGDLHRHMHFGEGHDWHDVYLMDWPSVKADIESGALAETDPLPVPAIDLGQAAGDNPTGSVTTSLAWNHLDDDGFERLLYDLLRDIPEHENVQWMTKTRATDRGRDLSLDRMLKDGSGGVRSERVAVQAKHWLSKSVGPDDVQNTLARVQIFRPKFRALLVITSGRFSIDAVAYAEQHNETGVAPFIDLWPDSKLETLLAQRPGMVAAYNLR